MNKPTDLNAETVATEDLQVRCDGYIDLAIERVAEDFRAIVDRESR